MNYIILSLSILFSSLAFAQNTRIDDFNSSKKILKRFDVFNQETLYCGCKIVSGNKIDAKSCGYIPPSSSKRALKVEWEHIVPASALSEGIAYNKSLCGKKSKRQCLEDKVPEYAYRTADLYNLVAEDGLINQIRSDKPMEELSGSDKSFGQCDIKTNKRGFTPRKEAKGFVARTYLYMDKAYPAAHVVSNKNRKLYEAWNKMYPVTKAECQRAKMIESLQKNENEFVKKPCQASNLW
jgi:deoxyribonuclease-1